VVATCASSSASGGGGVRGMSLKNLQTTHARVDASDASYVPKKVVWKFLQNERLQRLQKFVFVASLA
jgi:hypothetical protein